MKRILATLTIIGISAVLTSCGGGGGSSSGIGGGFTGSSIEIKSLSVSVGNESNFTTEPVIYPNDVFYIRWDVETSSFYSIAFYLTSTDSKPTVETNSDYFAHQNCDEGLFDCSKGLKCHYFTEDGNYYIECASYSSTPGYEGWGSYGPKKLIDPYTINYLSADAYIFKADSENLDLKTEHSVKSIPITFLP